MGPVAEYEQILKKAAEGNDAQSVPNAVVIAADSEGKSSLSCVYMMESFS
jgi:hypothetical protein